VPDGRPPGLGRLLPSADRRHRAHRRVAGGLSAQPGAAAMGHPPAGIYTYLCVCVGMYIYIYIYIYREREGNHRRFIYKGETSTHICVCVCV